MWIQLKVDLLQNGDHDDYDEVSSIHSHSLHRVHFYVIISRCSILFVCLWNLVCCHQYFGPSHDESSLLVVSTSHSRAKRLRDFEQSFYPTKINQIYVSFKSFSFAYKGPTYVSLYKKGPMHTCSLEKVVLTLWRRCFSSSFSRLDILYSSISASKGT